MQLKKKRWIVVIVSVIVIVVLLLLYAIYDPSTSYLAPKCPFKLLTGLDCPACGNQRAIHNLLNGNIVDAFLCNPFLWLSLPYVVLVLYATLGNSKFSNRVARYVIHRYALCIYIAAFILWWIIRNTPLWQGVIS